MKIGIIRSMLLTGTWAAALATLTSCKPAKPEVTVESEPPPPATPAPTATPKRATPIAAATPAPDPLAPPGIFYLLQKASITTDEGIVGLKPGQGLRQVSPGRYEVDGRTIQLPDHQVTNNLRIARQFVTADTSAQATIRQNLQQKPIPQTAAADAKSLPRRSSPTPAAGQPARSQEYLPGVSKQASGLDSSSNLGAGHTRTKDGWLWQKDADGSWMRVRPLGR